MRDDRAYLMDLLEAIEGIERYAARGRDVFEGDELIQTWIVHHIQIIGEATTKLSQRDPATLRCPGGRSQRCEISWYMTTSAST